MDSKASIAYEDPESKTCVARVTLPTISASLICRILSEKIDIFFTVIKPDSDSAIHSVTNYSTKD
jgi:hypothetical protein